MRELAVRAISVAIGLIDVAAVNEIGRVRDFSDEAGHCGDTSPRKKTARDAGRFGNAYGSVS
ncbi:MULTISPECIES: hypothetical protein [unclassified Lysobacter]|uniref:hypothetical protein n=1 Tax=unclassified Lysobacter TaxID=2635362 RepID=UPI001BED00C5|nr:MULTISPECIES: hypothetical protein [unclassified Lysobacter]MBT2746996.1 hypothetical protein [Lysobacter sp. ISL-42]MBT2750542.1 hypothetical protein [Lysobacter sp. ISL-50]MBT2776389.1 hypothetical protein [Lysobacter sp. ISL-54]MBT2780883.1 hypothetical protein [Lysobacter sp. ISL-52]